MRRSYVIFPHAPRYSRPPSLTPPLDMVSCWCLILSRTLIWPWTTCHNLSLRLLIVRLPFWKIIFIFPWSSTPLLNVPYLPTPDLVWNQVVRWLRSNGIWSKPPTLLERTHGAFPWGWRRDKKAQFFFVRVNEWNLRRVFGTSLGTWEKYQKNISGERTSGKRGAKSDQGF